MFEKYLKNKFLTLYIIPLILGIATVLSYQPFNIFFLNFFILPIFFYLLVYINKKSKNTYRQKPYKKNFFIFGTMFGFGFYLSGIHWIMNALTFEENFKFLIPLGLIFIPLFLSLFFSLTILIIGPILKDNLNSIFLLSSGLALSDFIRAKIFTGFPWNLWAYSFSSNIEIIQILNIFGLYAFNLISITIFMLPAVFFFKIKNSKKFTFLCIVPLFFLISYFYGSYSINQNKELLNSVKDRFKIKVISPNFKLEYGLSKMEIKDRLNKLIRYSEPSHYDSNTLFIWPEGVFSGYSFDEIKYLKIDFINNFKNKHLILFGINTYDKELKGTFNSMIIVNNKLQILSEYKKRKLVPFGEFLPFENLLNKFGLKKITEGHGSFLKGGIQKNLIIENLNILPLICYEIIFTHLVQSSSLNTNLIANISEDGWFGDSIGPHQHFAKGIFRAIEHNSFIVRSANKGISAIINNKGEIIKKLYISEPGSIEYDVPLIKDDNRNKNNLIFFILLITYILFFNFNKNNNGK